MAWREHENDSANVNVNVNVNDEGRDYTKQFQISMDILYCIELGNYDSKHDSCDG